MDFAEGLRVADDIDLCLFGALVSAVQVEVDELDNVSRNLMAVIQREESNRRHYAQRKANTTRRFATLEDIRNSTSDRLFRLKFRMSKDEFELLCDKIKDAVGEEKFANKRGAPGEIRSLIALRMLCGGSYLDLLGRAYGVESIQSIFNYFHTFIDWLDVTFSFPLVDLLRRFKDGDETALHELKQIASHFAVDSDGVFWGCIGAIDGLAVRIRMPANVPDPSNYFCRKNFYALNVQVSLKPSPL